MNPFCISVLLLVTNLSYAISPLDKVMKQAQKRSPLEDNVRVLSDEIGGRLPGTPALRRAVDWSVKAFKQAGAEQVFIEPFTMQVGWQEGPTQIQVEPPNNFTVRAVSLGWSPALLTQTPVRVVDVGFGSAKEFQQAGELAGAVLLLHSKVMKTWDDLFDEYLDLPPIVERAVRAKATAIALISRRPRALLYRHMNVGPNQIDVLPMFIVAREDGLRISRLLAQQKPLIMNIDMPNQISPAFTSWNVIAEIKGREKPEEWVLLGAHLDSWDLGTGALDNGCNVALVIDAFRAIKKAGIKPRRSIRFALFSGEEQGFIGSHAYVLSHYKEMNKAAGVVILDAGSGAITGFSLNGRKDILTASQKIIAPLRGLGVKKNTVDADVGTDNLSFLLAGLPNLLMLRTVNFKLPYF
ncbi:M20/M25/M40 family metallo-hydrolase [Legionella sp. km772]|uniref:M20/M25/M40 family metallo-hydrolase n=1 Tax=Legionella sp. km772 TaxID=2498111 RepID=UPI000F8D94C1|nr:M20/M25/M40 family metallo-hydrolase [Legionella sp. km772]RUR04245.1 M20/M25/M40 family metallo-hydrolase [Legionella sp. km772]